MMPTRSREAPFETLDDLLAFLEEMATTPSEEAAGLTELDHGLQCAAILRGVAPDDPELQVAGLLHDVGHTFSHIRDHGAAGGLALQGLMGERVAELVRLHIPAKRYLVTTSPDYRDRLSELSIMTLIHQGGDMSLEELKLFRLSPYWKDSLRLRRADEAAKVVGLAVAGLDFWREPLARVVAEASIERVGRIRSARPVST